MNTCPYQDKEKKDFSVCGGKLELKADKSKPISVEFDDGSEKYLTKSFKLIPETFCYYHSKKLKGLFSVTVEQIREREGRASKDGLRVKGFRSI